MSRTLRLYFEDPYLQSFDARVIGKHVRNGSTRLALDRSAFYPEGGGQPADSGTLNGLRVTDVQTERDLVWHEIDGDLDDDAVSGVIDWNRRFDHMQQHHGQHLLSAAFENLFSIPTTSFHLGPDRATIDLATETLDDATVRQVESLANRIVWECHPVHARFVPPDEVARIPLRKPPTVENEIRIVSVGDFDHSACGGTHPTSTGAVGLIAILRQERRANQTRVEFVCGQRAFAYFTQVHAQSQSLARELTVGLDELGDTVTRLRDAEVTGRKKLEAAKKSLIALEADRLIAEGRKIRHSPLVVCSFEGRDGNELQDLAMHLTSQGAVALLGTTGPKAQITLARPDSLELDCAAFLRDGLGSFNGRGGGRPGLARGGLPNDQLKPAIQALDAALVAQINGAGR